MRSCMYDQCVTSHAPQHRSAITLHPLHSSPVHVLFPNLLTNAYIFPPITFHPSLSLQLKLDNINLSSYALTNLFLQTVYVVFYIRTFCHNVRSETMLQIECVRLCTIFSLSPVTRQSAFIISQICRFPSLEILNTLLICTVKSFNHVVALMCTLLDNVYTCQ